VSGHVAGRRSEAAVARTTAQTGGRDVARAIAQRTRAPAAVWGMAMFIAAEAALIGSFIAAYYYFWSLSAKWPPAGIPRPHVAALLISAGCLALTVVPVQAAWRAGRRGRARAALGLVLVAFVVQCAYFAYAVHALMGDLHHFKPSTNAYGSIYYLLLGADDGHVFVGLLMSLWLMLKLARGLTTYRANALQAITWYWTAVAILTLVVVGTISSATL
jgi:heme/copper-type cytochrome/quinol oxidase subunit 3